ncbi:Tubulin gamma-3 chain [Carex littledalei]|uniref:Tubulin gamma-3 chain n=1 Tax=Carex littledalei TaxID=544730 RepID=A0A833QM61_9POAL|nr:Tubulin gamma-3 chain [Carex littledalei]
MSDLNWVKKIEVKVSGLMLANHTSIRHLFSKCLSCYKTLRKKQAFIDNYRKFPMFADNDLSEFDESREIIESLVDEYKACESPDYIKWGMEEDLVIMISIWCLFNMMKWLH